MRDEFWFLAQLFVKPGVQKKGIGTELLQRTMEHADSAGATERALITFAFNTVSQVFTSGTGSRRVFRSIR
jgi:GNAT superfamily N-acetyltransferase